MAELVTEPGKLFRVQSRTPSELTRTQLWDGRAAREHPGLDARGRITVATASGFPTLPRKSMDRQEEGSSSSGGAKEGLQWSDLDGLPMEELEHSEDTVRTWICPYHIHDTLAVSLSDGGVGGM